MENWPLVRDKVIFLSGINWEPLPTRHNKNIRGLARRRGAHSFATYSYQNQDDIREYVIGIAYKSSAPLSKSRQETYALALIVVHTLTPSGYAIIELQPDVYAFFGCIDGVLLNDIVGDKAVIDLALKTFIEFNPEPDEGWKCYAPPEFSIKGSTVFDLEALLTAKLPSFARFQRVNSPKKAIGIVALTLVLFASYYSYQHYANKKAIEQLNTQRDAFLKSQIPASSFVSPWVSEPRVKTFVDTCTARWQSTPLSLAGWRFSEAECSASKIRFAYTKPDGGTVGDFVSRVNRVFNNQYPPYFNIPGPGDIGGYTQTIQIPTSNDDAPLYHRDFQIQRMTTFVQQTRLGFTFAEESNAITASGEETLLPWRVFSMTLKTDIPPSLLFSDFDDTGVRIHAIKLELSDGRLMYQIEGKFYANY